jgi:uroporphyrinogen decarboxylase
MRGGLLYTRREVTTHLMNYMSDHAPDPNIERLLTVLRREGEPGRVPLVDFWFDPEIIEAVLGQRVPRIQAIGGAPTDHDLAARYWDLMIEFAYTLGYDYVKVVIGQLVTEYDFLATEDTAALSRGERRWARESEGLITTWADYERYPWPDPTNIDYFAVEYVINHLPEGMGIIGYGGNILEPVAFLMGFQNLAIALYEQPDLVEAMFERVGELSMACCEAACQIDAVRAILSSDDMGFRTGTLISPRHLRQYVLPWHKRVVECAHRHGRPLVLHSCGNLETIMDDLIDDVGIDAKHSFEDAIMPVTEVKANYGDRVAILGGVDVDFLCRATEEEVRAYVRNVIDVCGPGGGYALGTGNSVTNYIPVENYLAMLDEGRRYGVYPLTR